MELLSYCVIFVRVTCVCISEIKPILIALEVMREEWGVKSEKMEIKNCIPNF